MSITNELRRYVAEQCSYLRGAGCSGYNKMLEIADRIDAEYQKAIRELNNLADASVLLPVDADGVPIHVGDELTDGENLPSAVCCMLLRDGGWTVASKALFGFGIRPSTLRHVKPDSWEGIIADAIILGRQLEWLDNSRGDADSERELVERCRRLAGEAE